MKIYNRTIDSSNDLEGLNHLLEESQFSVKAIAEGAIHMVATSFYPSTQEAASTLQTRLERAGYTEFSVQFSSDGVISLVDGRALEEELNSWVASEGGRADEAAQRIRDAFYTGSRELSLMFLDLRTLPSSLKMLQNLTTLYLGNNHLEILEVPDLRNLQELWIEQNHLTSCVIPGTLAELRTLIMFANPLETLSLPDTLTNLRGIFLSGTELHALSIPDTLVNLEELLLFNNHLNELSIPATLIKLRILSVSGNNLTVLSITSPLPNLRELNLERNLQLDTLPPILDQCIELRELDVNDTAIPLAERDRILTACHLARREALLIKEPEDKKRRAAGG
ncbi:MAG: hypothetical protein KGI80_05970 [Verrucomicrobiota bacterium]|nr:hypothetical protein [Verrucomicrobiota bacterium]